jgi:hypothetical protein
MHTRRVQWYGKQKVFKVSMGLLHHHTSPAAGFPTSIVSLEGGKIRNLSSAKEHYPSIVDR